MMPHVVAIEMGTNCIEANELPMPMMGISMQPYRASTKHINTGLPNFNASTSTPYATRDVSNITTYYSLYLFTLSSMTACANDPTRPNRIKQAPPILTVKELNPNFWLIGPTVAANAPYMLKHSEKEVAKMMKLMFLNKAITFLKKCCSVLISSHAVFDGGTGGLFQIRKMIGRANRVTNPFCQMR